MKNIILALLIVLFTNPLIAQDSFSEVNNNHTWTWLGIDFSQTKLIGRSGFSDPLKISTVYLPAINMLVFEEAEKYDVMKAFNMLTCRPDPFFFDRTYKRLSLSEVYENMNELFVGMNYRLEEKDIKKIVSKYNFKKTKEDVALAFIVESLDKEAERAIIWVTVINTKNKKILLAQRMSGKPKGFGFRNYWARPILRIIKEIETNAKYGYNIQYTKSNLSEINGNLGCGKRPVAPPKYNNPQYKQTKEYKAYIRELNKWKTCTGSK